jgi:Tfp pilus assembly PilM family ATPase
MAPFQRVRPVVAVEIGDEFVKVLRSDASGGGVGLSRIALSEVGEGGPSVPDFLAKELSNLPKNVSIIGCLPRRQVNLRMIELPSTDPAEIADMIDLQAGKQTPYSKEEVQFDYRITGSPREGYSRVMLVIIQRSALRHHFNLLEEAGIRVDRMSVSSEGLAQWCVTALASTPNDEAVGVLDMDSDSSDLVVIEQGGVSFTRSLRIGARQFSESRGEWSQKLAREIRQSLAVYRGEGGGRDVARLVLTGAGFGLEDSAHRLEEELQIAVDRKNSLSVARRLPDSVPMRDERFRDVSITSLLGMVLDPMALEFDLMPDPVRMRRNLTVKAHNLASFGMLLMGALIALSMLTTLKLLFRDSVLKGLEKEFARVAHCCPVCGNAHWGARLPAVLRPFSCSCPGPRATTGSSVASSSSRRTAGSTCSSAIP